MPNGLLNSKFGWFHGILLSLLNSNSSGTHLYGFFDFHARLLWLIPFSDVIARVVTYMNEWTPLPTSMSFQNLRAITMLPAQFESGFAGSFTSALQNLELFIFCIVEMDKCFGIACFKFQNTHIRTHKHTHTHAHTQTQTHTRTLHSCPHTFTLTDTHTTHTYILNRRVWRHVYLYASVHSAPWNTSIPGLFFLDPPATTLRKLVENLWATGPGNRQARKSSFMRLRLCYEYLLGTICPSCRLSVLCNLQLLWWDMCF